MLVFFLPRYVWEFVFWVLYDCETIFGVRRPCAALALLQNFCIPASAEYL